MSWTPTPRPSPALAPLATVYGAIARGRRRWYATHPGARRRLARPVVSVGSLTVGGSGKTPLAAHVARVLLAEGWRPSVLSRGYARQTPRRGVTVVRDAERIRSDVARAGDEPMMLARQLSGVAVVVAADRYQAGVVAETRLDCSVHVLDDGFQHLRLARDVDLLIVEPEDLELPAIVPAGRLREPPDAARAASALLVPGASGDEAAQLAERLGVERAFPVSRSVETARRLASGGEPVRLVPGVRAVAVAGIARPERFFADLERIGVVTTASLVFPDHHVFTVRDVERIVAAVRETHASLVLTTEKDACRLMPHRPFPLELAWLPLVASVTPADDFRSWLGERLAARGTALPVPAAQAHHLDAAGRPGPQGARGE